MAWEKIILDETFLATNNLSGNQYYAVQLDTVNQGQIVLSTAGSAVIGILQDKPNAGQEGSVMLYGVSKAVVGGNVTYGDNLKSNALGQLVTAGAGDVPVAVALQGQTSAGDLIPVFLSTNASSGSTAGRGEIVITNILLTGIGNADYMTGIPLGMAGAIVDMYAVVRTAATTGGKTATLTLKISSQGNPVTGASLVLTSALATPALTVLTSTACGSAPASANNTFAAADTLKITGSNVTAFAEGAIDLHIIVK